MNKSLIGIVVAYITGIISAYFFNFPYKEMGLLAIFVFLLSLFLFERKRFLLGLIIFYLAVILTGIGYYEYRARCSSSLISPFLNTKKEVIIRGTIKSDIDIRPDRRIFLLKSESIQDSKGSHLVKGKLQVTYAPGDFSSRLDDFPFQYRDTVEMKGRIYLSRDITVPGVFDYRKYLQRQGISGLVFVRDADKITKIGHNYRALDFFNRSVIAIRYRLSKVISQSLPEPEASVLSGILLGRRKAVPLEIQDAFSDTGMMHMLAVSGLHVGLVAAIFLLFFRRIYIPHKTGALLTIAVVFIYAFITGARPSAMRAAIMAGVALVAFVLERDKNFYNSLAIACLFILIVNPLDLFNVGFQLSFSATLAILYFAPKIQKILPLKPQWLFNIIAVTTSAQIGVIPIVACYFNKVSLVGILSNIIIIPFVGIIVGIGLFTFFVSFLGIFFVQVLGFVNGLLISGMVGIIKFFSGLPYAFVYVCTPSIIFMGSYYIFAGWIGQLKSFKDFKKFGFVLLITLVIWFSYSKLARSDKLSVTFLDVGQGDAVFLEFPDRSNMLIDGGGTLSSNFSIGERIILPFLWHKRVPKINRMVLTHPHYNHLDGLLDVLKYFKVGKVFINGQNYISGEYREFLDIIEKKHIPMEILRASVEMTIGNDIVWKVLNPLDLDKSDTDRAIDNNSIVSRFIYGDFSMLFTGDIREEIQNELARQAIRSTVLQVPNHAKGKISQRFLLKVNPECVIISAETYGENALGDLRNSAIYSTSSCGTIVLATDGQTYHISTVKENH